MTARDDSPAASPPDVARPGAARPDAARPDASPGPVGWLRAVVVDAADPPRLAAFWQAVLGVGIVEEAPDWIQLAPDRGGAFLAFEPAPAEPAPAGPAPAEPAPSEPAPSGPAPSGLRTRPDIEVDDMDVARARIEALGGRLVEVIHARPGESHYRMADPEGNEFTVVLPLPPDIARLAYGDGPPGAGSAPV